MAGITVSRIILTLLVGCVSIPGLTLPRLTLADPLKELLVSPEMQAFERNRSGEDINGPKWLKPGTEFAALFTIAEGYLELNTWVAPATGLYVGGQQSGAQMHEYVEAERVYSAANVADVRVRILVPHPKYASMLPFGLVHAFAELEPPMLRFENQEQIEVRGRKATLYTLKNGSCSLIFKITKGALVQLAQNECRSLKDLVSLAETLDIARLERKLHS